RGDADDRAEDAEPQRGVRPSGGRHAIAIEFPRRRLREALARELRRHSDGWRDLAGLVRGRRRRQAAVDRRGHCVIPVSWRSRMAEPPAMAAAGARGLAPRRPLDSSGPMTLLDKLGLGRRDLRAWAIYDLAQAAFQTTIIAAIFPIYFQKVAAAGMPGALATSR